MSRRWPTTSVRSASTQNSRGPSLTSIGPSWRRPGAMPPTWSHESHPSADPSDRRQRLCPAPQHIWSLAASLELPERASIVQRGPPSGLYSVNVYGPERSPRFLNAVSMYHPSTVTGSLVHNGDGPEPGFKSEDGKWDLRPHASRIEHVDRELLGTWHALMESGSAEIPVEETRMVFTVNRSAGDVLQRLTAVPTLRDAHRSSTEAGTRPSVVATDTSSPGGVKRSRGTPSSCRAPTSMWAIRSTPRAIRPCVVTRITHRWTWKL